ncbi:MAG: hypothetical protein HQK65_11585 [Desulfamplus sp.]|nr:hypothetical protein [Desulfamplus sp.]
MNSQLRKKLTLNNGANIAVLGGGPAGSFFAILLLREAKKVNLNVSVSIIDKKAELDLNNNVQQFKGCNFCAGIISPRLQKELVREKISPPDEVLCEKFTHIWIHGLWKNFPLKVPAGDDLISVFRGSLPSKRKKFPRGFDPFILQKAVDEGANIINAEALAIQYTSGSNKRSITIKPDSGNLFNLEADFVCISTGVNLNPGKDSRHNSLLESYRMLNPGFRPPQTRACLIFELKPGSKYLKKYMNREIYIIVSGTRRLDLEHAALIPKGDYLTVALTGKSIDKASLPEDTDNIIKTFLSLDNIQNILPHIDIKNTPVACRCSPNMAVTPSTEPFSDRIALAGDALGARLYRDGLFSALITAQELAKTVIYKGIDKKSIAEGYGWVGEWLKKDNRYGKLVIGSIHVALKSPLLSRILYQAFATEMKFKKMDRWPLGSVLWKIGSGSSDYREVFNDLMKTSVFISILRGAIKTFRNILTEHFFGLNWESYGRYPTVIIKEKRDYFKKSISEPLGIKLDKSPDMERMYAIKIRASSDRIFEELGKFGSQKGKFLRLRFVDVRRTSGLPNQEGSVVSYNLRGFPISMGIRLAKTIAGKALFYEPSELFATNGRLIFDISPTKDGNNRLVIYTAFDFRKGENFFGKIFWRLFKLLFPDYAHDVVWNHAICSIKGESEKIE